MTSAVPAGLAGVAAVAAGWELLGIAVPAKMLPAIGRVLAPARAAGGEGRLPSTAERRRLVLLAVLAAGGAGWLLGGVAAVPVAAPLAPAGAAAVIRLRRRRWRARLAVDAPAALAALADALAGGHGLQGALAAAARDGALGAPARRLLGSAGAALALGVPAGEALERLRRQAGPGPWDAAAAAILLQRETGGDLVALLRGVAATAGRAAQEAADARAASVQARLTARIVLGLPALAAVLLALAAPGTAAAMLRSPAAVLLLTVACGLQAAALLAVRRIVREPRP